MDTYKSIYDFTVKDIKGLDINLADFRDRVVMIVNTASKCGFTKQYDDLQKLYLLYKDKGFSVLGFPANNFMNQEPGDNEAIAQFCRLNYGVTFPMFAKVSVRGKEIHPLFNFLTKSEQEPAFRGRITWNFNKFLLSREGQIISRFNSKTRPLDAEVIKTIESALS